MAASKQDHDDRTLPKYYQRDSTNEDENNNRNLHPTIDEASALLHSSHQNFYKHFSMEEATSSSSAPSSPSKTQSFLKFLFSFILLLLFAFLLLEPNDKDNSLHVFSSLFHPKKNSTNDTSFSPKTIMELKESATVDNIYMGAGPFFECLYSFSTSIINSSHSYKFCLFYYPTSYPS